MPTLKQKFQRLMFHLLRGLFKFAKFLKKLRSDTKHPKGPTLNFLHSKKAKTLALAILLVLIILPIYFFFSGRNTEASWWDEKWAFRKSIQLTNSGAVQTNVYVALTVDTSDTTKFQADCGDLRFTKNDGKIMPYLIASGCGTANTSVYVSFDSYPTGQQTIWQYYGNPSAENGFSQTQTGALAKDAIKMSIINGTAFVDFDSGGKLANALGSKLVIADYTGLELIGYIKSAGTGETLGSELLTNESFETGDPPTSWLATDATLSRVSDPRSGSAGAYAINVLGTGGQASASQNISFTSGALYYLDAWLRNVDMTDGYGTVQIFDYISLCNDIDSSDTTWTNCNGYRTKGDVAQNVSPYWWSPSSQVGKSFRADDLSAKQVLTPSIAGVTITSTQNGSTYNWTSEESGFKRSYGVYETGSYTYIIFPTNFSTEASSYSVGVLGSEEKSPSPVAYWSFDEGQGATAHDETSNRNDGTITGATWKPESECVSGKCLSFDGVNDFIEGDISILPTTGTGTFQFWAKYPAGVSGNNCAISFSNGSANDVYLNIYPYETNASSGNIVVSTAWKGWAFDDTGVALGANNWGHFAFVADTSDLTLYLNGKSIWSSARTDNTSARTTFKFGNRYEYDAPFKGIIDEPKIYAYARTREQILQDYNSGLAGMGQAKTGASATFGGSSDKWLTDGLVGYWKMDEASWNGTSGEVIDASGNGNNGTSAGGATTAGGKYGNGGSFDGVDDGVSLGASTALQPTQISASFWVKRTESWNNTQNPFIWAKGNSWSNDGWYAESYDVGGFGNGLIVMLDGSRSFKIASHPDEIFPLNAWMQVSFTFDGETGEYAIYLDGKKQEVVASDGPFAITSTADIKYIGYKADGGVHLKGLIDETRIYNRALSPDEVKKLYEWAPGPVLHLKMDEKVQGDAKTIADDSTYGNNGTTHYGANTTGMDCTVPGKYGSACSFDGVDDYVDVTDNNNLSMNTQLSISAWIKPDEISYCDQVINKGNNYNDNYGFGLSCYSLGELDFYVYDADWRIVTSNGAEIVAGNWYNIAMTFDKSAGYVNFYLNGKFISKSAFAYNMIPNSANLLIGKSWDNEIFKGQIDDVRIYNYARTQEQILQDMAGDSDATGWLQSHPVAEYNFNEGYGSLAHNEGYGGTTLDATLNSGGSGTNATTSAMWDQSGKNGKAVEFDGTNDYVEVADSALVDFGANDFSVSFWVNKKAGCSNWDNVWGVNKWDTGSNPGNNEWGINLCSDGITDKFNFIIESGSTIYETVDVDSHSLNTWHHVVGLREGTNLKLFVDGENKKTTSIGTVSINNAGRSLRIANSASDSYYANALFDDVKIYPYALSEDEIKTDYNSGASAQWGSAGTASTTGAPTNSAGGEYCVPGSTDPCAAPVGEWKMEEKTGTTIFDTSGNGNDGQFSGTPEWKTGKVGSGLFFDGATDQVSVADNNNSLDGTGSITLSTWFYPTSANGNWKIIAGKGGAAGNYGLWYIDNSFAAVISSGGWRNHFSENSFPPGRWYHITGVFDCNNDAIRVFVDGRDRSSTAPAETANMLADNEPFYITPEYTGRPSGFIDQMKVYNYARTPAQIAWEYNKGEPVAQWNFDECQGATVHDESLNRNNGTINLGTTGTQTTTIGNGTCSASASTPWYNGRTGKYDASLNFDGTDDYVDLGNDTSIRLTNRGTLSAWIKFTSTTMYPVILGNASWNTDRNGYLLHANWRKTGDLYLQLNNASSYIYIETIRGGYNDGNWHHLVGTFDGSFMNIYVDGIVAATPVAQTIDAVSGVYNLVIGKDPSASVYYWNGQIDEVKIFNYALTAEQVKQLYNSSSALNFGN